MINTIILGCGWSGVLASYFLLDRFLGLDIVCIDKDTGLGGLLRTEVVDGFVFDVGGSHIIFSRDQQVLREMLSFLGDNVVVHRRKTYIYLDNTFVPYPFENGIWVLPPEIRAEILVSFIETLLERARDPSWRPRNLRDWIYGFFGKEIARLYLEPYNEKIWKRSLEEIDVDWVYTPGRLPIPDWRDIVRSGAGVATEGYREQARFFYPLRGGIQALYNAVLEKAISKGLRIVKGMKIEKIRKIRDEWVINDRIKARRIISTIPLNELVEALDAPEHILRLARQLDYNSVAVVGIALKKRAPDMHWIYVPDRSIVFHRYAWISNYSPNNTPDSSSYSTIIAEITIPPQQEVNEEKLVRETIAGLKKLGIISETEEEALFIKTWVHRYGYPIHTIKANKARREILNYLKKQELLPLGRWGTWRYMNMDKIYAQARTLPIKI